MLMSRGTRVRSLTGADLLATIATIAFAAGVTLALAAPDLSLAGDVPLWDAALVISMLALLASVLAFPEWWLWAGGRGTSGRACAGARMRRASHTVDLHKARSPSPHQRWHSRGVPRPGTDRALAGVTRRSRADWLLAARQRNGMPRLQRQHGRSRG